jgi:ankyrin repeat protein
VLILLIAFAGGCSRSSPIKRSPETDALLRAAREGKDDTVRALLSSPDVDVNATDDNGSTALIEAARYGHDDVVMALLARGADVKAKDRDGKTALMLAIQGGHDEVVRLLKQAGASE